MDASTPTAAPTTVAEYKDFKFPISQPYTEGHLLTANEAIALNRLRLDNIKKEIRKTCNSFCNTDPQTGKKKEFSFDNLADSAKQTITDKLTKFDEDYSFQPPTNSRAPKITDPVERRATTVVRGIVTDALKKAGKAVTPKRKNELIADYLERDRSGKRRIWDAAERYVKNMEAMKLDAAELAKSVIGEE